MAAESIRQTTDRALPLRTPDRASDTARDENGNGHARRGAVRHLLASLSNASAEAAAPRSSRAAWSQWADLRRELERSRRYERSFTLLRIALPRDQRPKRWFGGRPTTAGDSVPAIAPLVRSVDGVWTDETDVYLLLPECERANGERTLERIEASLAEVLPAGSAITLAAFPQDGRTSGALLNALHGRPVEMIERAEEPPPALSLVEEILVRTVASPLAGAEARREIPQDGAEASLT